HGASMMNVHAAGGMRMMRAAAEALAGEARAAGTARPLLVAVTVLTSLDEPDLDEIGLLGPAAETLLRLAALAERAGCDGVCCSPREIEIVRRRCGEGFAIVTPGIRPTSDPATSPPPPPLDDQRRVATAAGALALGADLLVIGRPVTGAPDPAAA